MSPWRWGGIGFSVGNLAWSVVLTYVVGEEPSNDDPLVLIAVVMLVVGFVTFFVSIAWPQGLRLFVWKE